MTDRFKGFIVALNADIRDDDAEGIIAAISMIKGVQSVEPVKSNVFQDQITASRIRMEVATKLRELSIELLSPSH